MGIPAAMPHEFRVVSSASRIFPARPARPSLLESYRFPDEQHADRCGDNTREDHLERALRHALLGKASEIGSQGGEGEEGEHRGRQVHPLDGEREEEREDDEHGRREWRDAVDDGGGPHREIARPAYFRVRQGTQGGVFELLEVPRALRALGLVGSPEPADSHGDRRAHPGDEHHMRLAGVGRGAAEEDTQRGEDAVKGVHREVAPSYLITVRDAVVRRNLLYVRPDAFPHGHQRIWAPVSCGVFASATMRRPAWTLSTLCTVPPASMMTRRISSYWRSSPWRVIFAFSTLRSISKMVMSTTPTPGRVVSRSASSRIEGLCGLSTSSTMRRVCPIRLRWVPARYI